MKKTRNLIAIIGLFCAPVVFAMGSKTASVSGTVRPVSSKVESDGTYKHFEGLTIISPVGVANDQFWGCFHERLASVKKIDQYFSLLPVDSYHMTTTNLFTQAYNQIEDWGKFLSERELWFQSYYQDLQKMAFEPEIVIRAVHVSTVIQLEVQVVSSAQVDIIRELAARYGMSRAVPSVFHITVGYLFQPIQEKELAKLDGRIRKAIQDTIDRDLKGKLTLEAPALSYFLDMTEFVKWDAKDNPFQR